MALKIAQFVTSLLLALALIPVGAHLLELPNKIGLSQERYFVVQGNYRGWALLGVIAIGTIVATGVLAILSRKSPASLWPAALAFLLTIMSLAIFFTLTYPTNVATENWTVAPEGWEAMRRQWEFSHAANAGVTLAAFCLTMLSILSYQS